MISDRLKIIADVAQISDVTFNENRIGHYRLLCYYVTYCKYIIVKFIKKLMTKLKENVNQITVLSSKTHAKQCAIILLTASFGKSVIT